MAITFRPDAGVTSPFDVLLGDLELRISTTDKQPDGLSMTYAENHGVDETLVYAGPLQLTTQNLFAPGGATKVFDMERRFTTPFEYDPSNGNLLIDVLVQPAAGMTVPDGNTDFVFGNFSAVSGLPDAIHQVSHTGPPQVLAFNTFIGGNVLQLTFVPEPGVGAMIISAVVIAFIARRRPQFGPKPTRGSRRDFADSDSFGVSIESHV